MVNNTQTTVVCTFLTLIAMLSQFSNGKRRGSSRDGVHMSNQQSEPYSVLFKRNFCSGLANLYVEATFESLTNSISFCTKSNLELAASVE